MNIGEWFELLSKLGPFISGVALVLGAAAAWWTVFLVHRRTVDKAWVEGVSDLYREFWKDPEMREVRRWIVSENEYAKLEPTLRRRFGNETPDITVPNSLNIAENETLEKVDRFCSFMRQFELFYKLPASHSHRAPWRALYNRSWIYRLQQREALRTYVKIFWPYFDI